MSLSRVLQYSNRRHYLTLAAIAGLSLYLLQRSLADISLVAPHVLGWSATYCGYPILALAATFAAVLTARYLFFVSVVPLNMALTFVRSAHA